jgi:hypothetical protein
MPGILAMIIEKNRDYLGFFLYTISHLSIT